MGLALVRTPLKIRTANLTEKRSSWSFLVPLFSSGMGNCLDWPLRTVGMFSLWCTLSSSLCLVNFESETCKWHLTVVFSEILYCCVQLHLFFFSAQTQAWMLSKSVILLQNSQNTYKYIYLYVHFSWCTKLNTREIPMLLKGNPVFYYDTIIFI